MTGFFVRIQRGGKWAHIDFDELTDEEFESLEMPSDDGWRWAVALAKWIRDNINPQPLDQPGVRLHVPSDSAAVGVAVVGDGPD
jgi:hypothetical protein